MCLKKGPGTLAGDCSRASGGAQGGLNGGGRVAKRPIPVARGVVRGAMLWAKMCRVWRNIQYVWTKHTVKNKEDPGVSSRRKKIFFINMFWKMVVCLKLHDAVKKSMTLTCVRSLILHMSTLARDGVL